MYQNLFSLDYIVNDEKKSVLMSVLNEDFIRMNRERIISSCLRAFLSQIDDDAIDEKEDIFFLFFSKKGHVNHVSPYHFTFFHAVLKRAIFRKQAKTRRKRKKSKTKEKHTRANRRVITRSSSISHTTYRPLLTTT